MEINQYPRITSVSDGDFLLVQTASDGAYKSILGSDLKTSLGGNTTGTGTITATPLLDGITGAVSARSIRQLLTTYTRKSLQAVLDSGATQDISFVDGILDTASLKTFAGNNNAYVKLFYDQVGGFASNSTSPPKIIDTGTLETAGGKPTLAYSGNFLNIPLSTGYPFTAIAVIKISNVTGGAFVKYGNSSNGAGVGCGSGTFDNVGSNLIGLNENVAWLPSTTPIPTSEMSIIEINATGASINIYLNGNQIISGGGSCQPSNDYNLGGYMTRLCNCNISEDIVFNRILDFATRAKIISNMMNFYNIT